MDELANLWRQEDVVVREPSERIQENLGAAPGWCRWGHHQYLLPIDPIEASIDVGLLRKLFFDESNAEAQNCAFEGVDAAPEVHAVSVGRCRTGRNLVARWGDW